MACSVDPPATEPTTLEVYLCVSLLKGDADVFIASFRPG